MKNVFLGGVSLLALVAADPGLAADVRAKAPVYKAAPTAMAAPYHWSGFYIGAQVGRQWGDGEFTEIGEAGSTVTPGTQTGAGIVVAKGLVGGGHVGFNWQAGQIVFGVEADFEGSGVDGAGTIIASTGNSAFNFEQKWQGSLRGRLGWALGDVLMYVTGGYAFAEHELSLAFPATGTPLATLTRKDTWTGWTFGGGVERAVWNNWTARLEYRYTKFDEERALGTTADPSTGTATFAGFSYGGDVAYHTVRSGLTYRFGDFGKAPVAASMVGAMPPYYWSGLYVGAQAGYQWGDSEFTEIGEAGSTVTPGTQTGAGILAAKGVVGGGHVGVNWQVGQIVFGVEADFEGSGVDGAGTIIASTGNSAFNFEQKWQGSVRGRIGWARDRVLTYVTGGVAFAEHELALAFPATGTPLATLTRNETWTGWTLGTGVEWALWNNWTARLEHRYTKFEEERALGTTADPSTGTATFAGFSYGGDIKYHTIRAGLSYRFGDWGKGPVAGKGPVVTKY